MVTATSLTGRSTGLWNYRSSLRICQLHNCRQGCKQMFGRTKFKHLRINQGKTQHSHGK